MKLKSAKGKPALAVFHDAVPNAGLRYHNPESQNFCPGVAEVCKSLLDSGIARFVKSAGSVMVIEKTNEITPGLFPAKKDK